jgi:hypothetical protein
MGCSQSAHVAPQPSKLFSTSGESDAESSRRRHSSFATALVISDVKPQQAVEDRSTNGKAPNDPHDIKRATDLATENVVELQPTAAISPAAQPAAAKPTTTDGKTPPTIPEGPLADMEVSTADDA